MSSALFEQEFGLLGGSALDKLIVEEKVETDEKEEEDDGA